MALSSTVDFSDFAPTVDGRLHLDSSFSYEFAIYMKGESTIRDVNLLCDLPELVLTQVNNHWLVHMGERIMRIGSELQEGRVPCPQCLADEYALWIVIQNTDPPQLGDVLDTFPGLREAEDVFGYDPDVDDPNDDAAIREEWMNRMTGHLLPPHDSHDYRRYDLEIMETFGQGIYNPADPRHPLHWFDRRPARTVRVGARLRQIAERSAGRTHRRSTQPPVRVDASRDDQRLALARAKSQGRWTRVS